jgi:hypothetical protein
MTSGNTSRRDFFFAATATGAVALLTASSEEAMAYQGNMERGPGWNRFCRDAFRRLRDRGPLLFTP